MKGFAHRDLKLENILLTDNKDLLPPFLLYLSFDDLLNLQQVNQQFYTTAVTTKHLMDAIQTEQKSKEQQQQQPSAAFMTNGTFSFHLGFATQNCAFHFQDKWQDHYATMKDLTDFGLSAVDEQCKEAMAQSF